MPIHLWLIALGVHVVFTRKRRPTDHAIVERHHQTMEGQVLSNNFRMLDLMARLNFRVNNDPNESGIKLVQLRLN